MASVTHLVSLCVRKSAGSLMSSGSIQIGSRILTVGQLSFCSHCILHPKAEDSWMMLNTGMMVSKPSSV